MLTSTSYLSEETEAQTDPARQEKGTPTGSVVDVPTPRFPDQIWGCKEVGVLGHSQVACTGDSPRDNSLTLRVLMQRVGSPDLLESSRRKQAPAWGPSGVRSALCWLPGVSRTCHSSGCSPQTRAWAVAGAGGPTLCRLIPIPVDRTGSRVHLGASGLRKNLSGSPFAGPRLKGTAGLNCSKTLGGSEPVNESPKASTFT